MCSLGRRGTLSKTFGSAQKIVRVAISSSTHHIRTLETSHKAQNTKHTNRVTQNSHDMHRPLLEHLRAFVWSGVARKHSIGACHGVLPWYVTDGHP